MITLEKKFVFATPQRKVFKDNKFVGLIFRRNEGNFKFLNEVWPKEWQVSGGGKRVFYDTEEECINHFK